MFTASSFSTEMCPLCVCRSVVSAEFGARLHCSVSRILQTAALPVEPRPDTGNTREAYLRFTCCRFWSGIFCRSGNLQGGKCKLSFPVSLGSLVGTPTPRPVTSEGLGWSLSATESGFPYNALPLPPSFSREKLRINWKITNSFLSVF